MSGGSESGEGETYSTYSLLHIASSFGEEEKIKNILNNIYLSKRPYPQKQPYGGTKQLQQPSQGSQGLGDYVESLCLDDRNLLDHRGNSPLFWACHFGQLETVEMLMNQYHMPVNRQNKEGDTPLAVSVKSGSFDVVCTLLDHGANPNIPNLRAETPLHIASCFGYSDICRELIKFGGWIDAEDDCGDTPLHWAVREEQVEIVEVLLSLGADPYHLNEDDESPLNLAESVGSDSLVNVFDSIACPVEIEIDGEAYGFPFMSNDTTFSKEETSNSMDVDVVNSDDSVGGNVDINEIDTSGTVYPSSLGKEEEYLYLAGKDLDKYINGGEKNIPKGTFNKVQHVLIENT